MNDWTVNDIPDLRGRVALVTGANRGLGLETTRALATHGAHVIMAVRNLNQGHRAEAEIKQTVPGASIEVVSLDLSSLASVREFAARVLQTHHRLDLLLNNAGVMATPRQETADGFEMQFGTNHLGHFALTGLLLPKLVVTPGSRVVTTTSNARRSARRIDFDDLQIQRSYSRWGAYGQSKRANLLFAFELQTRFTAAGVSTISVAAHPGGANTNVPGTSNNLSRLERFFFGLISQSAAMGALPQLYAATEEHITGGELVGPGGVANSRGYPKVDRDARKEYDRSASARLWEVSEELTGVTYDALRLHSEARG
ncbi:MAG: oxidoreductase [Chloroflexota bacterium]|nr:oxidoreductase [Chloroflexota bacterium]